MAHPNEALLRTAYVVFGRGDIDGYWSSCTKGFAFNVPGRNQGIGRYQGREQFLTLVDMVMRLTGGAFQEDVEDVLANDEHGVVLATAGALSASG